MHYRSAGMFCNDMYPTYFLFYSEHIFQDALKVVQKVIKVNGI